MLMTPQYDAVCLRAARLIAPPSAPSRHDTAPGRHGGPWTAETLATLVALGASHREVTDRETGPYPVWDWSYTVPGRYRLTLLGYLEHHDGEWVYVTELSHAPGDGTFGKLLKPTLTVHDREELFERATDLLNYAALL